MKNKKLLIVIGVSFVIGLLVAFMPPVSMESHVDILAPLSVVESTTDKFKTYFDSATVSTYRFEYKTKGDTTQLTWTFTDADMDNPMLKLYWFFKKDAFQKEVMDRGLIDIKNVAEKSAGIQ